jgi:hypothetical protein
VLADCFGAFFDQLDYFGDKASLPLHLVGGVAAEFESDLMKMASHRGISLGVTTGSPLDGLVQYHKV